MPSAATMAWPTISTGKLGPLSGCVQGRMPTKRRLQDVSVQLHRQLPQRLGGFSLLRCKELPGFQLLIRGRANVLKISRAALIAATLGLSGSWGLAATAALAQDS